jgi:hypothetical protein
MSTIVTRAGKGSPLTYAEVDANFTNLNTDKIQSGYTVSSLTINSITVTGGSINGTPIGAVTASTGNFTNLEYSGTLTGGTGVLNIGSSQIYKDSSGNVGLGTNSPTCKLQVSGGAIAGGYGTMSSITTACAFATRNVANKSGISSSQTFTTTVPPAGTICVLMVGKGNSTNAVITFSTGFHSSTATLTTGTDATKKFHITFVSNGNELYEISRNGPI